MQKEGRRGKKRKMKRHLCLVKLGVARVRGAQGGDPVDEGFWRLNKHVITDCLQLATLYLPTKVTIYPFPSGSIISGCLRSLAPSWLR